MSQPKVFEFAKEIGMETLALMDKIREWKLPVRSHMAELNAEMVEQIKTRLNEDQDKKSDAPAKKKKKKVAKKAAPAVEGTAVPGPKKVTKRVAPAAAATPAAAAPTAEDAATAKRGVVVKKAVAKVVIRRKADEEEAAAQAAAEAEAAEAEAAAQAAAEAEAESAAAAEVAAREAAEEAVQAAAAQTAAAAEAERKASIEAAAASAASAPVAQPEAPVAPAAPATAAPSTEAPAAAGPGSSTETPAAPSAPAPGRKREVVMTSQGPTSGIKSEAPRRNIIGRMDLSRVQPPPHTPRAGGPGGPPGGPGGVPGGPRPFGQGPRPLRTGFVAQSSSEPEAPATEVRRFDDKQKFKPRGPTTGPAAGPGAKERQAEEEVQTFSATEFRKREMVFQPKKKKSGLSREAKRTQITTPKASKRVVKVDQTMKVSDLAVEMGVKAGQLTKILMQQGVMATMNTELDFDTISLIAPEFQHEAINVHRTVDEMLESTAFGELEAAPLIRAPVVTIMGHVDHGKTSLLDSIRKADVASGEAGGITQHIGAYQVTTEDGHLITFIDTPGHEAFTAMRARGANVTDIAVIVVAADDGAMPQTIEAVNHAKAAGVPIIVAVNKMDKQGANPDRVKQQLTEQQLVPEEWGGETIYVPVSAHTKEGIPQLLEQIYLVAEVAELKANAKRSASGVVIESRMDKGRGPVATLLIQDGTLQVGQSIVCGTVPGRVRGLINDRGERVKEAGPSVPVEVLGLSEVPLAGDRFDVVEDDSAAARVADARKLKTVAEVKGKISLEDIFSKLKQGDVKELAIVLKTDVAGSVEAIKGMFDKVGNAEVKIKVIHSAVGGINESDVLLASTAKGIIVGFNVRPDGGAQAAAKRLGVDVKTYTIVYDLMDEMKKALAGLLAPEVVEKQLGRAEVRNTFTVPKIGTIAGCFVVDGKINRNAEIRLVRDGKIVLTGKIGSLKRFKDDAKEVAQGYECGIGIDNFNDVKVGDVIEAFMKESIVRELA